MKIQITMEFDENELGPKWMNKENLESLIYGKINTKKELLKIIDFKELKN